jgi:two-component system capsular synthesis response regulator RcsB
MKIKVILADDHPVLIAGILHELSGIHTIDVVGTAFTTTALIDLLARVHCDVLVTDYVMPGGAYGDGMTLLSLLRRHYPQLKIVVFTSINNPAILSGIQKLGVNAVLNKVDDVGYLISGIHAVHAGVVYFSPVGIQEKPPVSQAIAHQKIANLTRRESEVLRLYVSGASIQQIATELNRTKQTISAQKTNAMRKLGISREADLYQFAYETGIIETSNSTQYQEVCGAERHHAKRPHKTVGSQTKNGQHDA